MCLKYPKIYQCFLPVPNSPEPYSMHRQFRTIIIYYTCVTFYYNVCIISNSQIIVSHVYIYRYIHVLCLYIDTIYIYCKGKTERERERDVNTIAPYIGQASWILSLSESCPCESLLKTQKDPSSTKPFKKVVRNEWRRWGGRSRKINNINHHNHHAPPHSHDHDDHNHNHDGEHNSCNRCSSHSNNCNNRNSERQPKKKAGQEEQLKWR